MAIDTAKRAFLRGRLRRTFAPAPPWALAYDAFTDACSRCGECLDACPQRILVRSDGGFPTVDFARGECTFCRACLSACPTDALLADIDPPWTQTARIAQTCLTYEGVHCQSCRDSCAVFAIAFQPAPGRVPQPSVDATRCTGCGACVSPCPRGAIAVLPPEAADD